MPGAYQAVYEGKRLGMIQEERRMQFTGHKPSWLLYTIVGTFALLKDMLDIAFGAFPGIGTVVSLALGACFSIIFFLLFTVFDQSGGGSIKNREAARRSLWRIITLGSAVLVDMLPIINFLPVTTLSIIFLYWMAKRDWKKSMQTTATHQHLPGAAYV